MLIHGTRAKTSLCTLSFFFFFTQKDECLKSVYNISNTMSNIYVRVKSYAFSAAARR